MRRRHLPLRLLCPSLLSALVAPVALAALIALGAAFAPAGPALAQPRPGRYDVVIIGGGKDRADAVKARDAFARKVWLLARQKEAPAWPQIMRSDDVPGLKPGFHVAILAMCSHDGHDAASRKALADAARALDKGSYVRTVTGTWGDPCPDVAMLAPPSADEKKLRDAIDKAKSPRSLIAYGSYLKEQGRFEEARLVVDEALALAPGDADAQALAEVIMVLSTD